MKDQLDYFMNLICDNLDPKKRFRRPKLFYGYASFPLQCPPFHDRFGAWHVFDQDNGNSWIFIGDNQADDVGHLFKLVAHECRHWYQHRVGMIGDKGDTWMGQRIDKNQYTYENLPWERDAERYENEAYNFIYLPMLEKSA